MFLGRYPDYMKLVMWIGLGLVSLSLFLSSFVSQVSILLPRLYLSLTWKRVGLVADLTPRRMLRYWRWNLVLACDGSCLRMVRTT